MKRENEEIKNRGRERGRKTGGKGEGRKQQTISGERWGDKVCREDGERSDHEREISVNF